MKSKTTLILVLVLLHCSAFAQSDDTISVGRSSWNLPCQLNDQNTTISFEVDSTWHLVKGTTKNITGSISHPDEQNPQLLSLSAVIPVASFDTENQLRDGKMHKVMAIEDFPNVVFESYANSLTCTPEKTVAEKVCTDKIRGNLTIRGKTLGIELPLEIRYQTGKFNIKSTTTLNWADYGVEDPSILVAKLDKLVTIHINITL